MSLSLWQAHAHMHMCTMKVIGSLRSLLVYVDFKSKTLKTSLQQGAHECVQKARMHIICTTVTAIVMQRC